MNDGLWLFAMVLLMILNMIGLLVLLIALGWNTLDWFFC